MNLISRLALCFACLIPMACGGKVDNGQGQSDSMTSSNASATNQNSSDAGDTTDSPVSSSTTIDSSGIKITSINTTYNVTPTDTGCLQVTTFRMPDDAENNNNGWIGPFCCTGQTMTINDREWRVIGYVYFYGFGRPVINVGDHSYAHGTDILVSAVPQYGSEDHQNRSVIQITTEEMLQGAVKSTTIGALKYTAKITHADMIQHDGYTLFNMETVQATVTVALSDGTSCPPIP